MNVPFLDLRAAHDEIGAEIEAAVQRVCRSGYYLLGPELEAFEREFADYIGARHCIGVGNGLDALHISLRALGIGSGDEVIVPAHTFIATWLAVTQSGATPVPVEPDATYNIDPLRIEAAITPRTRAIMPVHLYGLPANMPMIRQIADSHGLAVIEDAAQAHGAMLGGRKAGTFGHTACWSFYPGKNLGAYGDGGAITTDDDALAERMRKLRNYGSSVKYVHEVQGFNSRLDDVQAAVLRVKLRHLDGWNARRRGIARLYMSALAGSNVGLPCVPPEADPVWHLFVVRSRNRAQLQAHLADAGIQTLVHYPQPPFMQECYASLGIPADAFPATRALAAEVLSLPMGPHISEDAATHVATEVIRFSAS